MRLLDQFRQAQSNLLTADRAPASYQPAYAPVPVPLPERVGLPGFCSLYGSPCLILAEKVGNSMKLLSGEKLPDGLQLPSPAMSDGFMQASVRALPPAALLGEFSIDSSHWGGCAHCGTRRDPVHDLTSIWWCMCGQCRNNRVFHCAGNRNGLFRRICGGFTTMDGTAKVDTTQMQGWKSFSTAQRAAERPQAPPYHPPLAQIAASRPQQLPAPSSVPRIGYRGRQ